MQEKLWEPEKVVKDKQMATLRATRTLNAFVLKDEPEGEVATFEVE